MRILFPAIALISLSAVHALNAADNCSADHWGRNHQATVAESREQTLPAAGNTMINPGNNGGIRIHGWNHENVLVKACIHASAATEDAASSLLKEVKIVRGPGDIESDGPATQTSEDWEVSYEIWMPNASNLEARTLNGGIALESLNGRIRFQTQNGGVSLINLAGDVDGTTQNGGLTVQLGGSAWRGSGLRAETQNGGIHISVSDGYSAQVEASTVNGGIHSDFPVQLDGKTIAFDLGSGGAPVRLKTTNGGVHISRS